MAIKKLTIKTLFRSRKPKSLPGGSSRKTRLQYKTMKGMLLSKKRTPTNKPVFPRAKTQLEYDPVYRAFRINFIKGKKGWTTARKMSFEKIISEAKRFENYPDMLNIISMTSRRAFLSESFAQKTTLRDLIFDGRFFPETLTLRYKVENGKGINAPELIGRLLKEKSMLRKQIKKEIPILRKQIKRARERIQTLFFSTDVIVNYPHFSDVFRHKLMEEINPKFDEVINEVERLVNQE